MAGVHTVKPEPAAAAAAVESERVPLGSKVCGRWPDLSFRLRTPSPSEKMDHDDTVIRDFPQ